MATYLKAKDVFIQRRTVNNGFEEYALITNPNSVIVCDSCNNLIAVPSESFVVASSSYAITASYALNGGGSSGVSSSLTSSHGVHFTASEGIVIYTTSTASTGGFIDLFGGMVYGTSSWALNVLGGATVQTASYVPGVGVDGPVASASYALTASYSLHGGSSGTSLNTGSSYPITSSWAISASYAPLPKIKSGLVSGSAFGGGAELTSSITFTTPFVDNLYSISIIGEDPRSWYIDSKTSNGFIINSNSSIAFSGMVFWQAIYRGEY